MAAIPVSDLDSGSPLQPTDLVVVSRDGETLLRATVAQLFTSPALAGSPTAPTPPLGNSTTRLATTAFVQQNIPDVDIDVDSNGIISRGNIPEAAFNKVYTVDTVAEMLDLGNMTGNPASEGSFAAVRQTNTVFFLIDDDASDIDNWLPLASTTGQLGANSSASNELGGTTLAYLRGFADDVILGVYRQSNDDFGPILEGVKANGAPIAAPTNISDDASLLRVRGVGYFNGYKIGGQLEWIALDVGATKIETRIVLSLCPPASDTLAEALALDHAAGLSLFGSTVIDQDRHVRLRSYAVSGLPSASPAGQLVYVSDGTGNKRLGVSDGTDWRFPDGAVVS